MIIGSKFGDHEIFVYEFKIYKHILLAFPVKGKKQCRVVTLTQVQDPDRSTAESILKPQNYFITVAWITPYVILLRK